VYPQENLYITSSYSLTGKAGLEEWLSNDVLLRCCREEKCMVTISIKSDAFAEGERIPTKYTCSGEDISPALSWGNPPAGTESLALICDDPDCPTGLFTHWMLVNIPPDRRGLPEGVKKSPALEDGSIHGANSFGKLGYNGPCPPPGKPHRYYYHIYALDIQLKLRSPADRRAVDAAMKGHVLATGEYMGVFSR
jgi:Raf kinase inhibitor-like YbhB/YbcL family protein